MSNHPLRWLLGLVPIVVLLVLFTPKTLSGPTSYILVAGDSMSPTLEDGDLVVVRSGEYSVGDVIAFQTGSGAVIHRIVGGSAEEGFVMQGDNKPDVDTWRPTGGDVLGEKFLHVPNAGVWVQRVFASPLMLGGLFGGLGALMIWSPERRSKRRGAHSVNVRRASSTVRTSGATPRGAGTGLLVMVALTLILAGITTYLFLQPHERVETLERPLFEHTGSYSYEATVAPSVVYDGTTITPESTDAEATAIYTSLLENLQIDFLYEMTSSQISEVEGVMTSELHIAAGENLWTRTIPLLQEEIFEGSVASGSFAVELAPILGMIETAEGQTEFAPPSYELTVVTEVVVDSGTGSLEEQLLTLELPMRLTDAVLSVENVPATTETVTIFEETTVPNDIELPWTSLSLRLTRAGSGALLAILLLSTALFAYLVRLRVGRGEVARIRLRYGPLIVPVTKTEQNGNHPVEVSSIADLVRLAKRAEQMVFYKQNTSGEHYFFVPDGAVVYEYTFRSKKVIGE